jgi:hypothetical protein
VQVHLVMGRIAKHILCSEKHVNMITVQACTCRILSGNMYNKEAVCVIRGTGNICRKVHTNTSLV